MLTRLTLLALGLLAASAIIFCTLRILPGDVAQTIVGTEGTPEQVAALRAELGLDRPVLLQYLAWIGGVLTGDLGESLLTGAPVAAELAEKARVTVPLGLLSLVVAIVIAVPFGVIAALRRNRVSGAALNALAQLLAAVPVLWAGMMLIVVFAIVLGWLPAQGFPRAGWGDPGAALRALILPALTIGVVEGALLLRFVRSATLTAIDADFVRTAAAKGHTRTGALLRHGLPAVGLSIITMLGVQIAGIVVGAVVIEQVFNLPGIGRMLVADVGARDLTKVQGELLALTGFVLIVGFLIDLVHRAIDPRQRDTAEVQS
ncbi:peptide/nickel transport system permease protein [Microbacterium amylolyticum]|uniref:Peptide/nickel transport system permease protein n=1 Tax=Microbacterium amylolyticum TaxID=936337 RepID=A0ABS4ZG61_9MICO|nr:peptide/nickel transport system permease protein [Microbacterium amylolyticum]